MFTDDSDGEFDIVLACVEIIIGIVILAFEISFAIAYACISIGCWFLGMGDE